MAPSLFVARVHVSTALARAGSRLRALAVLAVFAFGCSDVPPPRAKLGDDDNKPASDAGPLAPSPKNCAVPSPGCECQSEGELETCGKVHRTVDDYTACATGYYQCRNGRWSECEGDQIADLDLSRVALRRLASLPEATPCLDNPCDPHCQLFEDEPEEMLTEGGIVVEGPNGIELKAVPPASNTAAIACTSIQVKPSPQDFLVTSLGNGVLNLTSPQLGLVGEYFDDRHPTGIPSTATPRVVRIDPQVSFSWGNASPVAGVPSDGFSVRWSGYVIPTQAGSYRFYVTGDDGVRLWVGNTQLVNAWVDQSTTEYTSSAVTLQANVSYPIRLEYYDNTGGATAALKWSGPSTSNVKQTIASADLSTLPRTNCTSGTLEAESMTSTTGGSVTGGWNIWSNGSIYRNFTFGTGPHTVTVRAYSSYAGSAWGHMVVSIGGTNVYDTYVNASSWTDFAFQYTPATSGSKEVRVTFDNDYYSNGNDRNLYVDNVTIGCSGGGATTRSLGYSGPLAVTPAQAQFTVEALPSGCFAGAVLAAWDLDQLGTAVIAQSGIMEVVAPVAGTIGVKAYAGSFTASGQARVKVNVLERSSVNDATVTAFSGTASGADPMTVLYPYIDTVFPLGLKPPVIQWNKNNQSASAVKVSLRWPAAGTPEFQWATIIAEPNPTRLTIPSEVWKAFEQTAKGDYAAYVVQRIVGGVLKQEVVRPIRFAQAPLRGRIVYTEYGRSDHHAYIMGVDPGGSSAAYNMFGSTSGAWGCPVCHSVSANGELFLTSDSTWSNTPGFSEIESNGSLSYLSDMPNSSTYKQSANDWRGFGWAPLTPDGQYALSANNVYGNTQQQVVGIDSSRAVSVPSTMVSGGNGGGLKAEYFGNTLRTGTSWTRTDPSVNFDWAASSPATTLPVDGFSATWSGKIQPYFSETLTFHLTSSDGVRLTVNGSVLINAITYSGSSTTRTATFNATAGQKYDILLEYAESGGNAAVKLEWSSTSLPREVIPPSQLSWDDSTRGVYVRYYSDTTLTNQVLAQVEPQVAASWGNYSPMPNVPVDNFSSRWLADLEAPVTGTYQFCLTSDDAMSVKVGGTTILNATSSATNLCSSSVALVGGLKYALDVQHKESTGAASLKLEWSATVAATTVLAKQVIPPERLYLPPSYTVPTNGLRVRYYDTLDFNRGLAANPTSTFSATRIVPQANVDWGTSGNYRAEYNQLTSNASVSGRFTGRLEASCTGVTEFRIDVDDAGALWLNDIRVVNRTSAGTAEGAMYLTAGQRYDLKLDWTNNSGGAKALLYWKPCGAGSFTLVPSLNLLPTGDTDAAGFTRAGGDNGSGVDYFVWQSTRASGVAPTDVTSTSPGKWGLGGATMMVPSFAPNGSKLVFVDGDQAGGAGWRKGLSVFDFDQTNKIFRNRRTVVNTWPFGEVIKWPIFESDSRSIIYSSSPAGSYCCQNSWTVYGYMAPTDYYETPGRLMSVDSAAATPTPVYLARASQGERAVDANKAWQPTMLPVAAGGYRWVVFTSSRPYGNTINLVGQQDYTNLSSYTPMLNTNDVQSQLWVAAIDDTVSAATDRSYPAFWLPNQNYSEDASQGYINERGFWALEQCRAVGTGTASECEVNEDCCGGSGASPTALCKVDTPVTLPLKRHCATRSTSSSCSLTGGACATTSDCCPGTVCVNSVCEPPPNFDTYQPANVERIYHATCDFDSLPVWRFFDWQATSPNTNSAIEFYAESAADPDDFLTLPVAPTAVSNSRIVYLGRAHGTGSGGAWVGNNVGALLSQAGLVGYEYVKITMRFIPNTELTASPVLHDVRFSYSCPPSQ